MQIRIDASIKAKAQKAFKEMGLDLSSGVKMFLNQVSIDQCMPFVPSTAKTRANRKKWDKEFDLVMKHGKGYISTKEMFDDIEAGK